MVLSTFHSQDVDHSPLLDLSSAPQEVPRPAKVVLLAEDDEDLRTVLEHLLKALTYRVVACPDGLHAVSAFHTLARVDLLFTDYQMPGKDGLELARELTGLHPRLPVILVTGSILSPQNMQEIHDRQWVLLSKPLLLSSLANLLSQVFKSNRPTPSPARDNTA